VTGKEYGEGYTVVTPNGTILVEGKGRGLFIVSEDERCQIMELGEVSDDDLVNIFINCFHKIQKVELTKGEQEDPDWWGTHEIEVQRKGEGMAFSKAGDEE
jgi:hypothetical protein